MQIDEPHAAGEGRNTICDLVLKSLLPLFGLAELDDRADVVLDHIRDLGVLGPGQPLGHPLLTMFGENLTYAHSALSTNLTVERLVKVFSRQNSLPCPP